MPRLLFFLIFAAASHAAPVSEPVKPAVNRAGPITVISPEEGWVMPMGPGEAIYGSVSHPKAKFRINGIEVKPHPQGGFLAYLPIAPGTFTFHCELELPKQTVTYDRKIFVTPPPGPMPKESASIDPASIEPEQDMELRPGDRLYVQMRGTPGLAGEFQLQGITKRLPMAETRPDSGLYQGFHQFRPGETMEPAPVWFFLKGKSIFQEKMRSKGLVSVTSSQGPVAIVASPNAYVRTSPGANYFLFPPVGTPLWTAGRQGSETKILLSPSLSGWINTSSLKYSQPGLPPPQAALGTIKTYAGASSTTISLSLSETVPFQIEASPDPSRLTLRLFYTSAQTKWIIYDSSDAFISEVRWRQEESGTVTVTARLSPQARLWGYHAQWDNGHLKIGLIHPPRLPARVPALKGRTIVIDAGHTPGSPGAAGPRGILEKDVNLAIARELRSLLRQEGASVVMTRANDEEVGLPDRARMAREARGDVFLSIHNNNLQDGLDPYKWPHGYSVFYYQPLSLELARAVHRAYRERIPLPDENLRYGDFLVARITEMPAVLTESAYMTYPDQEAWLAQPSSHRLLAKAMAAGLRRFLEAEQERQSRNAPTQPKRGGSQ